jgi:hypothetical protein
MECEQSPSAKLTQDAKPSSPKHGRGCRSGQTLEVSLWVSPSKQDEVRGDKGPRPQDTGVPLNQMLAAAWPSPNVPNGGRKPKGGMSMTGQTPDGKKRQVGLHNALEMSGLSQAVFHASLPLAPASSEERKMTAGSGRTLSVLLPQSSPLGRCLKILLESETWASTEFSLRWKLKATKCGCSVFQLAPSMRRTGESDSGLFAANWPTPAARDIKGQTQNPERMDYVPNILKASWATPKRSLESGGPDPYIKDRPKSGGEATHTQLGYGTPASGCLARTEKFAVRLTTLSAWLMGYTGAYLAHWATASSGRLRLKSSKQ